MRSRWEFDPPVSAPASTDSFWGFAFGGGVDIKVLHVTSEFANAQSRVGNPGWTLRIAIGALFPVGR
jgi:hypothetical protein